MEIITSKDNSRVKYIASLHDYRKARSEGVVFIEGVRACEEALKCSVDVVTAVADEEHSSWALKVAEEHNCESLLLSASCFKKVSSTVNPQGVALVIRRPEAGNVISLRGDGKDIFLCLEDIQDPGNLGTMIRVADAFGFNAVLVTKNTVDAYNEKVIRSTMGSIWRVKIIAFDDASEMIEALRAKDVRTMAAELNGDELDTADITLPAAYFIGNEGAGLKTSTIDSCDIKIKIRMDGQAESLNAASAASILGYVLQGLRH